MPNKEASLNSNITTDAANKQTEADSLLKLIYEATRKIAFLYNLSKNQLSYSDIHKLYSDIHILDSIEDNLMALWTAKPLLKNGFDIKDALFYYHLFFGIDTDYLSFTKNKHSASEMSKIKEGTASSLMNSESLPNEHALIHWVRPGESVNIQGIEVKGGMFYMGSTEGLKEYSGIDPDLPIAHQDHVAIQKRGPSDVPIPYRYMHPRSRAAYLSWLTGRRNSIDDDTDFALLYLMGLERRIFIDTYTSNYTNNDTLFIRDELNHLEVTYKNNEKIFRKIHNLTTFLDFTVHKDISEFFQFHKIPQSYYKVPFDVSLALASFTIKNEPIPGELAYYWWMLRDDNKNSEAVEYSPHKFMRLFINYYHKEFGKGLTIRSYEKRLTIKYEPLNNSLRGVYFCIDTDLPDVFYDKKSELNKIAEKCYRRHNKTQETPLLKNLLDTPVKVWPKRFAIALQKIRKIIPDSEKTILIELSDILSIFPEWQSVGVKDYSSLATLLCGLGLGMEPDPRNGGVLKNASAKISLFTDTAQNLTSIITANYRIITTSLDIALALRLINKNITEHEYKSIARALGSSYSLKAFEITRLEAHIHWIFSNQESLDSIKRLIKPITRDQRPMLGDLLIRCATFDGTINSTKIRILEEAFKKLSIDNKILYSNLHQAPSEPVSVRLAEEGSYGFPIPQRPPVNPAGCLNLDFTKVSTLEADSRRASDILHAIFQDGSQATAHEPEKKAEAESTAPDGCLWGLSQEFSAFLHRLATRSIWTRDELEELAVACSILLDGALEHINEAAFDRFDQPFTEGDDPLEINQALISEITS